MPMQKKTYSDTQLERDFHRLLEAAEKQHAESNHAMAQINELHEAVLELGKHSRMPSMKKQLKEFIEALYEKSLDLANDLLKAEAKTIRHQFEEIGLLTRSIKLANKRISQSVQPGGVNQLSQLDLDEGQRINEGLIACYNKSTSREKWKAFGTILGVVLAAIAVVMVGMKVTMYLPTAIMPTLAVISTTLSKSTETILDVMKKDYLDTERAEQKPQPSRSYYSARHYEQRKLKDFHHTVTDTWRAGKKAPK